MSSSSIQTIKKRKIPFFLVYYIHWLFFTTIFTSLLLYPYYASLHTLTLYSCLTYSWSNENWWYINYCVFKQFLFWEWRRKGIKNMRNFLKQCHSYYIRTYWYLHVLFQQSKKKFLKIFPNCNFQEQKSLSWFMWKKKNEFRLISYCHKAIYHEGFISD